MPASILAPKPAIAPEGSSPTMAPTSEAATPTFNEAKRKLGVVAQEINFSPFEKVEDIVITQAGYYGISASQAKPKTEKTTN